MCIASRSFSAFGAIFQNICPTRPQLQVCIICWLQLKAIMLGVLATTNSLACCTKTAMQHIPQQSSSNNDENYLHISGGPGVSECASVCVGHHYAEGSLDPSFGPMAKTIRPKGLPKRNRIESNRWQNCTAWRHLCAQPNPCQFFL